MLHDHFLDLDLGPIGRVVTTEASPAPAHAAAPRARSARLPDPARALALRPTARVVTSEDSPATAHEFFFWTAETEAAQNLDIGHIVAAEAEGGTAVAALDGPGR